ncbi:MAG: hypothetical protein M3301_04645 [Chloroflexota bacterium]|nr:hypothetical protein [Chloroflexota bacterium]
MISLDGSERHLATLHARLAEIAGSQRWAGQVDILTRFRGCITDTATSPTTVNARPSPTSPRELIGFLWAGMTVATDLCAVHHHQPQEAAA